MKKTSFFTAFLVCLSILASAQTFETDYYEAEFSETPDNEQQIPQKLREKMDINVGLSSSFVKSSSNSAFISTINPQLAYNFSPKFILSGGLLITNTSMNGKFRLNSENIDAEHINYIQNYAYMQAQYRLSESLKITAGIILGTSNQKFSEQSIFNTSSSFHTKGYFFNAEYKINENMHIGVEFQHIESSNPYLINSNYYSPFYSNQNSYSNYRMFSPIGF